MISVLMPTYNCSRYIREAIISILLQSYSKFEFLIIDDGSDDDTESIVKLFNDNRIKYVKKSHTGLSDSIEYGVNISKYDLITRMDADDITHPERLEKQYKFLICHPDVDLISCWYAVFNNYNINYLVNRSIVHEHIVKNLSLFPDICHPGIMFRKQKLIEAGGFAVHPEYDPYGDYVVWLRTKSKLKFHNLPNILHFYRDRSDSLSNVSLSLKRDLIYKIQVPYYNQNLIEEFGLTRVEEIVNRGWREYLFGDVKSSYKYWKQLRAKIILYPSIILAILVSFLPTKIFTNLFGKRIIQRLSFKLMLYNNMKKKAVQDFKMITMNINKYDNQFYDK